MRYMRTVLIVIVSLMLWGCGGDVPSIDEEEDTGSWVEQGEGDTGVPDSEDVEEEEDTEEDVTPDTHEELHYLS